MRTTLAIALCASLAHAQPIDVPTLDATERPALAFKAGEVVPFDGVCMTDGKAVEVGKRLASAEAQVAALDGKTVLHTPLLVGVIGATGAAVVTAIVLGVALALKK